MNFHLFIILYLNLVFLQPLPKAAWDKNDEDDDDASLARKGARSATDIARARLDKLMKNPAKPVSEINAQKSVDINSTKTTFC